MCVIYTRVFQGSPFLVHVVPGKAHARSTQLRGDADEPLRGTNDGKRLACEVLVHTRDMGGNRCDKGEANITYGYLKATPLLSAPCALACRTTYRHAQACTRMCTHAHACTLICADADSLSRPPPE